MDEQISIKQILSAFPPDFITRAISDGLLMVMLFLVLRVTYTFFRRSPNSKYIDGSYTSMAAEIAGLRTRKAELMKRLADARGLNKAIMMQIDLLTKHLDARKRQGALAFAPPAVAAPAGNTTTIEINTAQPAALPPLPVPPMPPMSSAPLPPLPPMPSLPPLPKLP